MKKILIFITCIMAGMGTSYAQITPPEITPCYGEVFFHKQQIIISCATEGARIFYTLDGEVPTTSSAEYNADIPLCINKSKTIKAIAEKDGITSEVSELECKKSKRAFLAVGKYGDKEYYMGKEAVNKNGERLKAIEYTGEKIFTPQQFKDIAWLFQPNGEIVDKRQTSDVNLTFTPNNNATKLVEGANRQWQITDAKEIKTKDNARTLYVNPKGYFEACTSSSNNKAHVVYISKGTTRTGLTVGNFGTICLPYDVVASNTEGATFYKMLGKKVDDGKTKLYIEEEKGTMKAGVPYFYKVESETINFYYLDEVKVSDHITGNYISHNGMTGISTHSTTVPKGMYIVNGTKIVKCGNDCTITNGHAYIDMDEVPTISDAEAKKAISLSTDDTTDITDAISEGESTPRYYNLQGQRVIAPRKGVYIHNGKKVIIK